MGRDCYIYYLIGDEKDLVDMKEKCGNKDFSSKELEYFGFKRMYVGETDKIYEPDGEIFSYLEICTKLGKKFMEENEGKDISNSLDYPSEYFISSLIQIAQKLKDNSQKALLYTYTYY